MKKYSVMLVRDNKAWGITESESDDRIKGLLYGWVSMESPNAIDVAYSPFAGARRDGIELPSKEAMADAREQFKANDGGEFCIVETTITSKVVGRIKESPNTEETRQEGQ